MASCGLSTYVLLAAMATLDKVLKRQKVSQINIVRGAVLPYHQHDVIHCNRGWRTNGAFYSRLMGHCRMSSHMICKRLMGG